VVLVFTDMVIFVKNVQIHYLMELLYKGVILVQLVKDLINKLIFVIIAQVWVRIVNGFQLIKQVKIINVNAWII